MPYDPELADALAVGRERATSSWPLKGDLSLFEGILNCHRNYCFMYKLPEQAIGATSKMPHLPLHKLTPLPNFLDLVNVSLDRYETFELIVAGLAPVKNPVDNKLMFKH